MTFVGAITEVAIAAQSTRNRINRMRAKSFPVALHHKPKLMSSNGERSKIRYSLQIAIMCIATKHSKSIKLHLSVPAARPR
jgi:hypothetical protein